MVLVIQDEQLARQLQQIADNEHRSVEDVLKTMVARYPSETQATKPEKSEAVKRVRRKVYAKARKYWESVGDVQKAAMTDEELNEQFGVFDEEGIPRLKSELKSLEPPVGSLAYAAKIARESQIHTGRPDLARRSDEILEEGFAKDLLPRRKGDDIGE